MKLQLLDDFASRHHGLVSFAAASRLGVSRSTWYRAIESGQMESLYPNVVRLWGSPPTFLQRALAAVWAAGADAMASHRTSAALWGVERPADDSLDVILPSRSRHSSPAGVVVHRPRDRRELRPVLRHGVPTTSPMRMLLDLGAVDEAGVRLALESVIASRVASPAAISAFLARHARKGRHGVTALRVALEELMIDGRPGDSELERRMAALLRDHGLPPAEFHPVIDGFEVDFRIIGTRVIIECEGWVYHGLDREQFHFDRLRTQELLSAGWVIVPCTWRQVVERPAAVAARIRQVLERWAPEVVAPATGERLRARPGAMQPQKAGWRDAAPEASGW